MSGVTWNDSLAVNSGKITIQTIDALTGLKKHDGAIQFNNEAIVAGSITHYDTDNGGAIAGYTDVDYSQARFLGTSLAGGQYSVKSHTPDKVLKSTSTVALTSLGRPQSIKTTNQDPVTKAITSNVAVDFSKLVFNARNEFDSGLLQYTATDDKGNLLSQTTVTYDSAQPANSTTNIFNNGDIINTIDVDYSDSLFNNDLQVVNSTKKVTVYTKDKKLISSSIIAYDQHGKKLKDSDPLAVKLKATKRPAKTPKKQSVPGSKTNTVPSPLKAAVKTGDSSTTQKTDNITRGDGTLAETRVTTLQDGKPVFADITLYAADGKTVTKTFKLDLSTLNYDPGSQAVSGTLNMQGFMGGTVLQSASTIQY